MVPVRVIRHPSLPEFLVEHGCSVEPSGGHILLVDHPRLPGRVVVHHDAENGKLNFSLTVDEIDLNDVDREDLIKLLDLNGRVRPAAFDFNTERTPVTLDIVESRDVRNLDDNELLSVFSSFELALQVLRDELADVVA